MISSTAAEDHGWGVTPQRGLYVEPGEIEAIVQRTNEKLEAETRQLKLELETRIAQLESRPAWAEQPAAMPGSAAKAGIEELHGSQRGLMADFDDVATTVERSEHHSQESSHQIREKATRDGVYGGSSQLSPAQECLVGEEDTRETSLSISAGLPLANAVIFEDAGESMIVGDTSLVHDRCASHETGSQRATAEDGAEVGNQGDPQYEAEALGILVANAVDGGSVVVLGDDGLPIEMMEVEPLEKKDHFGLGDSTAMLDRVESSSLGRSARIDQGWSA